jgi:hypothetical protein
VQTSFHGDDNRITERETCSSHVQLAKPVMLSRSQPVAPLRGYGKPKSGRKKHAARARKRERERERATLRRMWRDFAAANADSTEIKGTKDTTTGSLLSSGWQKIHLVDNVWPLRTRAPFTTSLTDRKRARAEMRAEACIAEGIKQNRAVRREESRGQGSSRSSSCRDAASTETIRGGNKSARA